MKKRIEKLYPYFNGFEISEDIAFISVNFPKKWKIPSTEILEEMFNVKTALSKENKCTYFFTNIDNGIFNVFDAVEFTIEFNINIEEKSQLLLKKIEELKNIFAEKPIEVLRTIQFKYTEKKSSKNKKQKSEKCELVSEIKDETNYENINISNDKNVNVMENDSLLEYAQELTE